MYNFIKYICNCDLQMFFNVLTSFDKLGMPWCIQLRIQNPPFLPVDLLVISLDGNTGFLSDQRQHFINLFRPSASMKIFPFITVIQYNDTSLHSQSDVYITLERRLSVEQSARSAELVTSLYAQSKNVAIFLIHSFDRDAGKLEGCF